MFSGYVPDRLNGSGGKAASQMMRAGERRPHGQIGFIMEFREAPSHVAGVVARMDCKSFTAFAVKTR